MALRFGRPLLLLLLLLLKLARHGGVWGLNPSEDSRLLSAKSFLMSHDAATGEIDHERDGIVVSVRDAYSITQGQGFVEQLKCGASAFDYRPYLQKNGTIIAHHGNVKVHKTMSESITEILEYLADKQEQLVMMYLSHFDGEVDGCEDATQALLSSLHVPFVRTCSDLADITVAAQYGKGQLFAIFDCVDERYDPSIVCYGAGFDCYVDNKNKDKAWTPFKQYLKNATSVSSSSSSSSSPLFMAQAHWQSSTESVPLGILHESSVLLDESRSDVNAWLAQAIGDNSFAYLNLVEVDNVCNNGPAIAKALQIREDATIH